MSDTNDKEKEEEEKENEKIEDDDDGGGVGEEIEIEHNDDDNAPVVTSGGDDDIGNSEDENLDDLLESLDIDNDFECWESSITGKGHPSSSTTGEGSEQQGQESGTGGSKSDDNHHVDNNTHPADEKAEKNDNDNNDDAAIIAMRPPSPNTALQQNCQKWKERLEREEVYSRLYRPSQAERLELKELETFLNMSPPKRGLRTLFARANSGGNVVAPADRLSWNLLIHPEEQQQQQHADATVAAANTTPFPSSILLKRGPVLYGYDSSSSNNEPAVEREAILLTRGLILAKAAETDNSKKSVVSSQQHHSLDRVILWQNVTFVEPVAGDDLSWILTVQNKDTTTTTSSNVVQHDGSASGGDNNDEHAAAANNSEHDDNVDNNNNNVQHLTFVCESMAQRDAWLDAMERVLIPHHLHNNNRNNGTAIVIITELGWQYKLVHRPAFTMAVTGMVADMVLPPPNVLDKLDHYNELTPLHYAVRLDMTSSIRRLLDAGADPNVKDADGRTCMYYAVRDELPSTTIALLEEYGAKESKLAKMETKGELFGRVQATEQVRKDRREVQQHNEAVQAQVKMNENLRLLNERGDKIEDLGNKANDLNENASNFATMAKQLKEKSKKQSKWLPFL